MIYYTYKIKLLMKNRGCGNCIVWKKMYNWFFGPFFKHFYYLQICKKNLIIAHLQQNVRILKCVSFVIFGHQTWDLEEKLTPPLRRLPILKPSKDRVKKATFIWGCVNYVFTNYPFIDLAKKEIQTNML